MREFFKGDRCMPFLEFYNQTKILVPGNSYLYFAFLYIIFFKYIPVAVEVQTLPYWRTPYRYQQTTGIVTDSGSVYTGLLGVLSRYIYRTGKWWAMAGWPSAWLECWFDRPGTHVWGGGWGAGDDWWAIESRGQPHAGWLAATFQSFWNSRNSGTVMHASLLYICTLRKKAFYIIRVLLFMICWNSIYFVFKPLSL